MKILNVQIFYIFASLSFLCNGQYENRIIGFEQKIHLEFYSNEMGNIQVSETRTQVFVDNNVELTGILVPHFTDSMSVDSNMNIKEITYSDTTWIPTYYLEEKGTKKSWLFDSLNNESPVPFNLDSLKQRMFKFEEALFDTSGLLYLSTTRLADGTEIEYYLNANNTTLNDPDTCVYFYQQYAIDPPFSFSRKLESKKRKTLTRVDFIFSAKDLPGNVILPRRDFIFEITPLYENDFPLVWKFLKNIKNQSIKRGL